jgi:glycosyltransferase involved in cell wall biosynthesis
MIDSQTKVLFVDSGTRLAGGQRSLIEILKCLDRSRFLPIVSSPRGGELQKECERLGVRWEPLPFESERVFPCACARLYWKLKQVLLALRGIFYTARLARKLDIDIVHANNFKAALIAGLACKLAGRVMIFHDRIHITHGILGRVVGRLSTRIIAISASVRAKYGGAFDGKTRLIPPGIDASLFEPDNYGGVGRNLVCYLGRISEEKGIIKLVECAPAVLERIPDVRFVIAGILCTDRDSAYLLEVKHQIDARGIGGKFEFPGEVDDVAEFLRPVDFFVLPSVKEPLGRVMIEAMLMGKPVVAFNAGGPSEVIVHGETGFLVDPGDTDMLGEIIARLLGNSELRASLGRMARKSVVKRFSSQIVTAGIVEVYDEVLHGRRRNDSGMD